MSANLARGKSFICKLDCPPFHIFPLAWPLSIVHLYLFNYPQTDIILSFLSSGVWKAWRQWTFQTGCVRQPLCLRRIIPVQIKHLKTFIFIIPHMSFRATRFYVKRNLVQGLVLKVRYFWTSFCQAPVTNVP